MASVRFEANYSDVFLKKISISSEKAYNQGHLMRLFIDYSFIIKRVVLVRGGIIEVTIRITILDFSVRYSHLEVKVFQGVQRWECYL